MTAPPARPHILKSIASTSRWSIPTKNDWGEDDAWDSGSDSENNNVKNNGSMSRSSASATGSGKGKAPTAPKPDPIPISPRGFTSPFRKAVSPPTASSSHAHSHSSSSHPGGDRSSSSVNLSSSYTHVQAPSPSSYPTPSFFSTSLDETPELENSVDDLAKEQERDERERAGWTIVQTDADSSNKLSTSLEDDEDGEVILKHELEPALFNADDSDDEVVKEGKDAIKPDIEEILKGEYLEFQACPNFGYLLI